MRGSAIYGFCLGVGGVLLAQIAPQPAGSILWWGFFTGQLTWGAALCWLRTGLPFATGAMAIAAATSGLLTALAATGHPYPDLPSGWWIPVGAGLGSAPLLLFVESRIHRTQWTRWGQYMESKSAWDIFAGRHIPDLRDGGA